MWAAREREEVGADGGSCVCVCVCVCFGGGVVMSSLEWSIAIQVGRADVTTDTTTDTVGDVRF